MRNPGIARHMRDLERLKTNRALKSDVAEQILEILRGQYPDLGPTLAGWLQGEAPFADGLSYDFDMSIQSGMGASTVTSVQKISCCSSK